jgi:hypothetical protein
MRHADKISPGPGSGKTKNWPTTCAGGDCAHLILTDPQANHGTTPSSLGRGASVTLGAFDARILALVDDLAADDRGLLDERHHLAALATAPAVAIPRLPDRPARDIGAAARNAFAADVSGPALA